MFVNDEKSTLHTTVDKTVFPLFNNYYRFLKSWSLFLTVRMNFGPIRFGMWFVTYFTEGFFFTSTKGTRKENARDFAINFSTIKPESKEDKRSENRIRFARDSFFFFFLHSILHLATQLAYKRCFHETCSIIFMRCMHIDMYVCVCV